MSQAPKEFQIIERFFKHRAQQSNNDSLILGIGDDCALIKPSAQQLQAISVDTSIAGRHFPHDADAFDIAYRALNVALSDLAAMGSAPKYFTLSISLNSTDEQWLQRFSEGLFTAAENAGVCLIGGDTTQALSDSPLSITVQVQGDVASGEAFLRSGAKVGDFIYVTDCLGDAAAGLKVYETQQQGFATLLRAYLRPEPAFKWANLLKGKVNSCIDISDGLLADLSHILQASDVAANIDLSAIPLSDALQRFTSKQQALQYALTGGDDYQLCLSSPFAPNEMPEGLHLIGTVIASADAPIVFTHIPEDFTIAQYGYEHFSSD